MSPASASGLELSESLRREIGGEAELFEKRGRSRRFERGSAGESVEIAEEQGWAVRVGDLSRSCFVCGSGEPPRALSWAHATPHPLALPAPRTAAPFATSRALDEPLVAESEAFALLDGIAREIEREHPGARLVAARLEEGSSESTLTSTLGIDASARLRAATLRLEVEAAGDACVLERIETSLRALKPLAIARRIADRLHARGGGAPPPSGRLVLAPPLAARLIESLVPLLVGPQARSRLSPLLGEGGRLAAAPWTLIDDGRHPAGVLAAGSDGEGVPTGEARLVEAGRFASPLLARWEAPDAALPGCARRASWRDLPRRAPTQLYLAPDPAVRPADLVAAVDSGAFLVEAEGGVVWNLASLRFRVPVSGFALERGRAAGALGVVELVGDARALFDGLIAVARDLAFVAGDGLYGAPTMLVEGLTVRSGRGGRP
ncbi:MAG: hypothetical protein H6511_03755 [Holophagales bacterium]|nr:hypothetical protein [Holophagales bacterium]